MTAAGPESGDPGQLNHSEELIDEAKDAAREALSDTPPAENLDVPATGTGLDEQGEQPAPRPN